MIQQSMETGWLGRRSTVLSSVAVCLSLVAATAATIYLDPASNGTWVNLVVGILVLAAPLLTTAALTRQRVLIAALVWFALGLPGSYFFGTSVFYAGVLLGAALLIDAASSRLSARTPAASPVTSAASQQALHSE